MDWLCFRTGRCQFLVYHHNCRLVSEGVFHLDLGSDIAQLEFTEYVHQEVFGPGDSVESFAFDTATQRFTMMSHNGQLQLFHIENSQLTEVIPRAVDVYP